MYYAGVKMIKGKEGKKMNEKKGKENLLTLWVYLFAVGPYGKF